MRVLYIGGTGEISYSCVCAGAESGQEITVFNRGRRTEPLPPNVRRIQGALEDEAAYRALGEQKWDVVCQFLAFTPEAVRRDLEVFGGKVGQYVFISTASAYQKPPKQFVITEQTPLDNPYWPYSQAKAEAEKVLMQAHAEGRAPVTVVRPSHTCRRRFPGSFVDGDLTAHRILHGKPVVVHGDGTSLWVLTHSDEFAVPFIGLLGNPKALGEAFHITSDEVNPWNAIYWTMGEVLGVEPELVHVPTDTLIRYRPEWAGPLLGDKTFSVRFDNTKIKSVVGEWSSHCSMRRTLKRIGEGYRERAAAYRLDEAADALLDRIAADQLGLGRP